LPGEVPSLSNEGDGLPASPTLPLRRGGELPMSGIVPFEGPRRLPRLASQQMAASERRALVHATEVRAIEFVARVGLQSIAELSELEGRLVAQTPLAEARLKMLADTAAGAIASELVRMVQ
jgi:hypothetical protein